MAPELTRRSVLQALGFGVAALGLHGLALARTAFQIRQCQPPSRLRGLRAPYVVRFAYGDGDELFFLAARHSNDRNSPTHLLIRHMITSMVPDRIILEAYFDDPARLLSEDLKLFSRNIHPENRFALALANERGIRAIGGDLEPGEFARASVSHGFNVEDVIGTHMVRMLAGQVSNASHAAVEARVKGFLEGLVPASGFDFEEWYTRRVGEPPSDSSFRRTYKGPCGNGVVAEIAAFESETRNQHLLSVIGSTRRDAARILTVFGANHLYPLFDSLLESAVQMNVITPADLPDTSSQLVVGRGLTSRRASPS